MNIFSDFDNFSFPESLQNSEFLGIIIIYTLAK